MRYLLTLAWLTVALTGCLWGEKSPHPVFNDDLKYYSTLNRWTENGRVYRQFETAFIVDVTYHSWEFRRAYVAEQARSRHLSPAEQKRMLAEEETDYRNTLTLTLNLYTPSEDWNNLDKSATIWKLVIEDVQRNEYLPFSVTVLSRHNAEATHYFPYINTWTTCYRVKFRRTGLALPDGRFHFSIASFVGSKRFSFADSDLLPPRLPARLLSPTTDHPMELMTDEPVPNRESP